MIDDDQTESRDSDRAYSVRSLVRGVHILRCFDVNHPEWGLLELSKQTKLHKATAYRLVKTLESEGFLALNQITGKYHLGPALLRAAYLTSSHSELVRLARPHIERLALVSGETVDLTVWADEGALFVDEVLTSNPFKPAATVGRVFTDFGNAHTKVLLAFGPEDRRAKFLTKALEPRTPFTIVDPQKVADEINRIISEGVAYDLQEHTMGICAVAAPVRDSAGEVRASLGVVAPEERFGPMEMKKHTQSLREAASALSRDLGYRNNDALSNAGAASR